VKGIGLMLGAFGLGLVLMVAFEHPLTRVLGLLCLFTFIVTGVFLIADPESLGKEQDLSEDGRRREG
jgi:uncharacterized membrane protein YkgB